MTSLQNQLNAALKKSQEQSSQIGGNCQLYDVDHIHISSELNTDYDDPLSPYERMVAIFIAILYFSAMAWVFYFVGVKVWGS